MSPPLEIIPFSLRPCKTTKLILRYSRRSGVLFPPFLHVSPLLTRSPVLLPLTPMHVPLLVVFYLGFVRVPLLSLLVLSMRAFLLFLMFVFLLDVSCASSSFSPLIHAPILSMRSAISSHVSQTASTRLIQRAIRGLFKPVHTNHEKREDQFQLFLAAQSLRQKASLCTRDTDTRGEPSVQLILNPSPHSAR